MSILKRKDIIIYGLGEDYEKKKEFLREELHIVGYCDSREFAINNFIHKSKLAETRFDYIYITSGKYYQEIKTELITIGIDDDKIICELYLWYLKLSELENINRNSYIINVDNSILDIRRYEQELDKTDLILNQGPEIYNRDGQAMETYFLRDESLLYDPYWNGKHVLWDRFNWKLDTHVYTNDCIFDKIGFPRRKYGIVMEARIIIPQFYERIIKHREICSDFDMIFTYDEELLEKIPNASFWNPGACSFYGRNKDGLNDIADNYKRKTKNISIIASDKNMCELHRVRRNVARRCKKEQLADTYGKFDGGNFLTDIDIAYERYRYQIVIENEVTAYGFSEKIISCFDAQTVPIYLGATQIGKFFNEDGIIILQREDLDHIDKVLQQCSEKDYEQRIPAIIDNYNRVKAKYRNALDTLYESYLSAVDE